MTERLPVISMYGPWANWVALGWKTIETRLHDKFACLSGKRIGIHVTQTWDGGALQAAKPYLSEDRYLASLQFLRIGGALICTVRVRGVAWLNAQDSKRALIDCGSVRRFGLCLTDVRQIPLIACKGKQGIWYYDIPTEEPPHAD